MCMKDNLKKYQGIKFKRDIYLCPMLGVSFVIWLTVVVDFGYVEEFV